jgi:ribosomal-protein-serine acetyltransferase
LQPDSNFNLTAPYRNGQLSLRRLTLRDAGAHADAVRESLPNLEPWMPWMHRNYTSDDSMVWIGSHEQSWNNRIEFNFGIVRSEDDQLLGCIGLKDFFWLHRCGSLGYWVRSSARGQGVAASAAKLAAAFGFKILDLNRIEILIGEGNLASRQVADKIGARYEGLLRERLLLHSQPHDAWCYSLIRSQYCES